MTQVLKGVTVMDVSCCFCYMTRRLGNVGCFGCVSLLKDIQRVCDTVKSSFFI